jgi:hypothetical protein
MVANVHRVSRTCIVEDSCLRLRTTIAATREEMSAVPALLILVLRLLWAL